MAPTPSKAQDCEPEVVMDGSGLDSKPAVRLETSLRCISGPAKEDLLAVTDSDPKTEEAAPAIREDSLVPQLGHEPQSPQPASAPTKRRSICRLPRCLQKCRLPRRRARSSSLANDEGSAKKEDRSSTETPSRSGSVVTECGSKDDTPTQPPCCKQDSVDTGCGIGDIPAQPPCSKEGSVVTECGSNGDTPAQSGEKPKSSKRCCSCKCLPKLRLRAPRCCLRTRSKSSKVSKMSADASTPSKDTSTPSKEESKVDFGAATSVVPFSSDKPLVNVPVVSGKPVDLKSPRGGATGGTIDEEPDAESQDITCH